MSMFYIDSAEEPGYAEECDLMRHMRDDAAANGDFQAAAELDAAIADLASTDTPEA